MKVQLAGPGSGYMPEGYRSWEADEVVEVDDNDEAAVAYYRGAVAAGSATLLEDVAPPKAEPVAVEEPPKRRGRPPLPRDDEGNVIRE